MTAKGRMPLAPLLYVLLPHRTIAGGLGDAARQHQVRDRLIAACRMAGMEVREATVVGEAVAGYLQGWGPREESLAERIDRAQAALNAAAGGAVLHPCLRSMAMRGSLRQWEGWTGLGFPGVGSYVVPAALVRVTVETGAEGLYVEPGIWMLHRLR